MHNALTKQAFYRLCNQYMGSQDVYPFKITKQCFVG